MTIPPGSKATPSVSAALVTQTVYGCKLDGAAIGKLVAVAAEGITNARIEYATSSGGTRVRSDSLDGLCQVADVCLHPAEPRRLDTLDLRIHAGSRCVEISIDERAASVAVEDDEAAWAIGRAEQLRKLLIRADGHSRFRRLDVGWAALAASVFTTASIIIFVGTGRLEATNKLLMLAGLLAALSVAVVVLVGRWQARRNQTLIWVAGPRPRRGWASWNVSERMAVLTLLLGLGSLCVTVLR
ncbi:hypothetical protein [Phytohabitans kaempferiae]|uniref:Uncharacterized protein n=1 Tax=Phytohabitans kaempferiae TaxID=1620943 RepID=A0ABV6MFF7_9ACTN